MHEHLKMRVVICAEHSKEAGPMVQAGPENPFMQNIWRVVVESEEEFERPENVVPQARDFEDD
ncbi:CAS1 domain-containing protein 1 [Biomphalaria glabrata]|nr:CAS1 domain-containing protein 1 [Biomphalaria glabrata]